VTTYRLGVDLGGTFTDFALLAEPSGQLRTLKVPSDPARPAAPVMEGLRRLRDAHGADPAQVAFLAHGTTIAVNTLIERTGARLALLVTEGFRDLLEIQRLRLPRTQDFTAERPRPLVPRERVFEVRERLRADGGVHTPLVGADVVAATRRAAAQGVEALAVCFLHAYRDARHEREAGRARSAPTASGSGRRSTRATAWRRGSASAARPSSSRMTRPRWCSRISPPRWTRGATSS
jgi:N-methylhydantoinase A